MLEDLMQQGEVLDLKEFHKDNTVDFVVKMENEVDSYDLEKKLKLQTNLSFNNMVLFNHNHQIKRYENECQILDEFFNLRLEFYGKRRSYHLKLLRRDLAVIENKARFITEFNEGTVKLSKQSKDEIIRNLVAKKFQT